MGYNLASVESKQFLISTLRPPCLSACTVIKENKGINARVEKACLCLGCGKNIRHESGNTLRKQAYSNILKILPPKNENFEIKILIFFIFCSKHRLWVLVRTASARRF